MKITPAKSKRNHREEYQRRMERALARGLSRSQARGHAKPGEPLINPKRAKANAALLEAAFKSLNLTGSLSRAAQMNHVSTDRLRRYLADRSLAKRVGRKWVITDARPREMTVLSDGKARQLILPDFANASLNGRHLAAVREFLADNDIGHLVPFEGHSIVDADGKRHVFETDPNILYMINRPVDLYEPVYHFVQRKETTGSHAPATKASNHHASTNS